MIDATIVVLIAGCALIAGAIAGIIIVLRVDSNAGPKW